MTDCFRDGREQRPHTLCDDGIDAHAIGLDVTEDASVGAAVVEIRREVGRFDIPVDMPASVPVRHSLAPRNESIR